jgi:hypothetical protein
LIAVTPRTPLTALEPGKLALLFRETAAGDSPECSTGGGSKHLNGLTLVGGPHLSAADLVRGLAVVGLLWQEMIEVERFSGSLESNLR